MDIAQWDTRYYPYGEADSDGLSLNITCLFIVSTYLPVRNTARIVKTKDRRRSVLMEY